MWILTSGHREVLECEGFRQELSPALLPLSCRAGWACRRRSCNWLLLNPKWRRFFKFCLRFWFHLYIVAWTFFWIPLALPLPGFILFHKQFIFQMINQHTYTGLQWINITQKEINHQLTKYIPIHASYWTFRTFNTTNNIFKPFQVTGEILNSRKYLNESIFQINLKPLLMEQNFH